MPGQLHLQEKQADPLHKLSLQILHMNITQGCNTTKVTEWAMMMTGKAAPWSDSSAIAPAIFITYPMTFFHKALILTHGSSPDK